MICVGAQGVIGPGGVQWMTAGVHRKCTGVFTCVQVPVCQHDPASKHMQMSPAPDMHAPPAGRGIIHSEMPKVTAGDLWGFQLWINLPKASKMAKPRRARRRILRPDRAQQSVCRMHAPGGLV